MDRTLGLIVVVKKDDDLQSICDRGY